MFIILEIKTVLIRVMKRKLERTHVKIAVQKSRNTNLISNSFGLDFQDVFFSVRIIIILDIKSELRCIFFIILRKKMNTNKTKYR